MASEVKSVAEYLASLPEERAKALAEVRKVILANLPAGIEEVIAWGMICYQVPKATYPKTYNNQPLLVAGLGSQKNHMAVYLIGLYSSQPLRAHFEQQWRATGKRLDAGKSCVRFKKLDDLVLPLVAEVIAAITPQEMIRLYEEARKQAKSGK